MPVGDVQSTEKGSAARYNDGKPELAQIPMCYWERIWETGENVHGWPEWVGDALVFWRSYQEKGSHDSLRCAFTWLPAEIREGISRVLSYGAAKYAQWNWTKGQAWSIPFNSGLRHIDAYIRGEELDQESGLPHLWHFACNVLFLSYFTTHFPEGEDWVKFDTEEQDSD